MTNTTATYYYNTDNMGSVVDVTDSTGIVAESFGYDPYGNARGSVPSSPANPVRYQGQYIETNTGLYNMRARVYDSLTERFEGIDPASPSLLVPRLMPYAFAKDQPT